MRNFGERAVLNGVSLTVNKGETMIIMGGSGCGKSTLLRHIIGAMKPTSGSIKIFGEEITAMSERELSRVRERFGMLFQSGALLQSLTVGENVALPIVEHAKLAPDIVESALNGTLSTQHGRVGGLSRRAHGQTGNPFG